MIRVLVYIAVVFAIALGAAWVAERPGIVALDWQGYRIETGLMTAIVAIAALIVAVMAVWGAVRVAMRSPQLATRFFRRRRRERGFDSLSKGLVALGVGDAASARRYGHEAAKLLKDEPAARLLLAQAAQLTGDREEARRRFEAMLGDPSLKAVALHGLFIEAERLHEPAAARHYAEEAARAVPGLPWAGRAVLGYQAMAEDWEAALVTLERNYAAKLVDKKTYRRHKAVLLTARALQLEDHDPDAARTLAFDAHGLAPDLVPSAVVAARLSTRRGDIRKTLKVVETTWKTSPHPDLAEAYAHARTGDSAQDRLKRVRALAALRPNSNEGAFAVAAAAIEAREWALARDYLAGPLRNSPTRRACLMMAELEDAEHGDRGRLREWLSRAVHAPSDPVWIADGVVSPEWKPVSPVTGRLDAFEWRTPGDIHPGEELEAIDEDLIADLPALTVKKAAEKPAHEAEPVAAKPVQVEPSMLQPKAKEQAARQDRPSPEAEIVEAEAKPAVVEAAAKAPEPPAARPAVAAAKATENGASKGERAAPQGVGVTGKSEAAKEEDVAARPIEFPLKHMPDDPGPMGGEEEETVAKPGFRFFN